MSKARVAVLKVTTGQLTVTQAATKYGYSRRHLHRLLARYCAGGLLEGEPQSRRPRTNPAATPSTSPATTGATHKKPPADGQELLNSDPCRDSGETYVATHHMVALSSVDTNKWRPLLAREWAPPSPRQATADAEGCRPLRQRQKHLTEAEAARMVARYAEGATVYELAEEFGIERRTVSARLKAAGATMRRRPPSAEQISEMVRLYKAGLSLEKVGERSGVSTKTVLNHLRAEGVRTRDSHGRERG